MNERNKEYENIIREGEARLDNVSSNPISSIISDVSIRFESRWNPKAKSSVAYGFGQITESVFADMKNRPNLYRDRFAQVAPEYKDISVEAIRSQIQTNTRLQLFLLMIYRDILSDGFEKEPRLGGLMKLVPFQGARQYLRDKYPSFFDDNMTYVEDLQGITPSVQYGYFDQVMRSLLVDGEVVPSFSEKTYQEYMTLLAKNPGLRREVRAARYYNGGTSTGGYEKYGSGLNEKQIYTIVIGYISTHLILQQYPGLLVK